MARTINERRAHRANEYGDHPESACEWLPLRRSQIELMPEGDGIDGANGNGMGTVPDGDMQDFAVLAAAVLTDDRKKRGGVKAPSAAPLSSGDITLASSPSSSSTRPAKRQRVDAPAGGPGSVAVVVCFRDLHVEQVHETGVRLRLG